MNILFPAMLFLVSTTLLIGDLFPALFLTASLAVLVSDLRFECDRPQYSGQKCSITQCPRTDAGVCNNHGKCSPFMEHADVSPQCRSGWNSPECVTYLAQQKEIMEYVGQMGQDDLKRLGFAGVPMCLCEDGFHGVACEREAFMNLPGWSTGGGTRHGGLVPCTDGFPLCED